MVCSRLCIVVRLSRPCASGTRCEGTKWGMAGVRLGQAQLRSWQNLEYLPHPTKTTLSQASLLLFSVYTVDNTQQLIASVNTQQNLYNNDAIDSSCTMEAIKDTINKTLESLNLGGATTQGTPAKEPSEEQLNELKSKYEKAGQEQVFVRTHPESSIQPCFTPLRTGPAASPTRCIPFKQYTNHSLSGLLRQAVHIGQSYSLRAIEQLRPQLHQRNHRACPPSSQVRLYRSRQA